MIIEDTNFYNDSFKRQINYLPQRIPFNDCLYRVNEPNGVLNK